MAIPSPEPGLVINYAYLWHYEHQAGADEGRKDRPSVIVICMEREEGGALVVTVLPITHRRPDPADAGIEIPAAVKRHLGLDDEPSWITVAEGNEFAWPGYDLRPRPDGSFVFGYLPPRLFNRVRNAFIAFSERGRLRKSSRD